MNTLGWLVYPHNQKYYKGDERNGKLLADLVATSVVRGDFLSPECLRHRAMAVNLQLETLAIQWSEVKGFLLPLFIVGGFSQEEIAVGKRIVGEVVRDTFLMLWKKYCLELDDCITQEHWEGVHADNIALSAIDRWNRIMWDLISSEELTQVWMSVLLEE